MFWKKRDAINEVELLKDSITSLRIGLQEELITISGNAEEALGTAGRAFDAVKRIDEQIIALQKKLADLEEFTVRSISAEQKGLLWLKDKYEAIDKMLAPTLSAQEDQTVLMVTDTTSEDDGSKPLIAADYTGLDSTPIPLKVKKEKRSK